MIDDAGQQLGVMTPQQALVIARQKALDLVEVAPMAQPPVCKIMDFGKSRSQEQKRAREARKHQKVIEVKEIKFRPKVGRARLPVQEEAHRGVPCRRRQGQGDGFLQGARDGPPGDRRRILERLIEELADVAVPETQPRMEGKTMDTILTSRPGHKPQAPKPAPRPRRGRSQEG